MTAPAPRPVRVGYLGPEGTFSHTAALSGSAGLPGAELIGLATIYDVVMAVAGGDVERGVVPIENSIEGSVSVTLDTLALDAPTVRITAEQVERIEQCLIAPAAVALSEISTVLSHPQASAQCARYLHDHLPRARVMTTDSTAEAVATVAARDGRGDGWAALGPRLAAERYGCVVLAAGVEDRAGNATRFVWLADAVAAPRLGDGDPPRPGDPAHPRGDDAHPPRRDDDAVERFKTSLVFWGDGSGRPGWLVRCLAELADRAVNMTRIESRPLKQDLGEYMFFVDCQGASDDPSVAGALAALAEHTEVLRVLGSYPAARSGPAAVPPPRPPVDFPSR